MRVGPHCWPAVRSAAIDVCGQVSVSGMCARVRVYQCVCVREGRWGPGREREREKEEEREGGREGGREGEEKNHGVCVGARARSFLGGLCWSMLARVSFSASEGMSE